MRRAASSPRRCGASPIPSSCSTRVEKAHPDVFNVLLQVLDDGRITDSQGRTVDFKNTILILTSNLGSQILLDGIGPDGAVTGSARQEVEGLLRRSFRPEFLNRLDEIVFYKPLTKADIARIIDLLMAGAQQTPGRPAASLRAHACGEDLDRGRGIRPNLRCPSPPAVYPAACGDPHQPEAGGRRSDAWHSPDRRCPGRKPGRGSGEDLDRHRVRPIRCRLPILRAPWRGPITNKRQPPRAAAFYVGILRHAAGQGTPHRRASQAQLAFRPCKGRLAGAVPCFINGWNTPYVNDRADVHSGPPSPDTRHASFLYSTISWMRPSRIRHRSSMVRRLK